jgi:hypothetical protein
VKFVPVFSLQLLHPYYRDQRCPDFTIAPTPETERLLRNHRCVLKATPNGLRVLIGGDAPHVPLIPLRKGLVFAFRLHLENPDFALFTDLSEVTNTPAPVYTNTEAGAAGGSTLSLVSRPPRVEGGAFAEVDIGVTDSLLDLAAGPEELSIRFTAKQVRWAYYCVTDVGDATAPLRIVDGDASPVVFSETNRTHLNRHPDPGDAIAFALGARYPEKQRFRFLSDHAVPCQQAARKRLQLQLGDSRLAEALPNPSLRDYSMITVTPGQTPQREHVLFHVLTYFTRVFPTVGS